MEGRTWELPYASPDFTVKDSDVEGTLWRHRLAFVEIKASELDTSLSANNSNNSTFKDLVAQAGNHARRHMASRPFQIFSVGLLVFGSKFCVAIYDRDGVSLSSIHSIFGSKGNFFRVVRRLVEMSVVDLGQDPSVMLLQEDHYFDSMSKRDSIGGGSCGLRSGRGSDLSFPSYCDLFNKSWCTYGPPIWTSLSLIGRGTSIWRVEELSNGVATGRVFIMKSAWRSGKRLPESVIYQSMKGAHHGVAEYYEGSDVKDSASGVITIKKLREERDELRATPALDSVPSSFSSDDTSPILHRMFLKTMGRPIWEYTSELELLKGFRAAVEGKLHSTCLTCMYVVSPLILSLQAINSYAIEAFSIVILALGTLCSLRIPILPRATKAL